MEGRWPPARRGHSDMVVRITLVGEIAHNHHIVALSAQVPAMVDQHVVAEHRQHVDVPSAQAARVVIPIPALPDHVPIYPPTAASPDLPPPSDRLSRPPL